MLLLEWDSFVGDYDELIWNYDYKSILAYTELIPNQPQLIVLFPWTRCFTLEKSIIMLIIYWFENMELQGFRNYDR